MLVKRGYILCDRLKNSIEQLKGKILKSRTPEEFHQNSSSFIKRFIKICIRYSNKDIIATIEDILKDLEKEEADTICEKISVALQNSKPSHDNLSKDECKALKELQSDASNKILPAEKGRSTVILNHEDYLEKMFGSYKQWSISFT